MHILVAHAATCCNIHESMDVYPKHYTMINYLVTQSTSGVLVTVCGKIARAHLGHVCPTVTARVMSNMDFSEHRLHLTKCPKAPTTGSRAQGSPVADGDRLAASKPLLLPKLDRKGGEYYIYTVLYIYCYIYITYVKIV